ncbi:MAG TPA: hypothetical protein VFX16_20005 [Pseudonocardiaceae bacterium]|nr:hypothetical protein [Pseudonocardiaceae bacterium]
MSIRGVPSVVVGSDLFEPLAHTVAGSLGAPWTPVEVVEHPIGGVTEEVIADRIAQLWPLVAARVLREAAEPAQD